MAGKYQTYLEYKNPGVKWIGAVPSHWNILPAKRGISVLTDFTANGSFASLAENVEYQDSGYARLIRMTDLRFGLSKHGVWVDEKAYKYLSKSALHGGELLMASVGSVGLIYLMPKVDYPSTLAPNMYLVKTNSALLSQYLYWSLVSKGGQEQILQVATTTAQPKLNKDNVRSLSLAWPTIQEQRTIAAFLDHETARIDRLIEKQQWLIKLLKEKRQAVISHAVTKGLDPNVPMKDSGVEWLGQVPEHWVVTRTKFLLEFVTSGSRGWADYYSDQGELFFRIANLTRDSIRPKLESLQHVMPPYGSEGERSKIILGDLLVSITADLGSVCVADSSIAGGYVSQHVALARPNKKVTSQDWLGYTVLSTPSKEQLLGSGYGGTKVQLSLEDVRELWVVVPPQKEQLVISEYLESKLSRFKALMDRTSAQIDLLKERRTALISAAVTGKIDVRNWQPNTSTQAAEPDLPMAAEQAAEYRV